MLGELRVNTPPEPLIGQYIIEKVNDIEKPLVYVGNDTWKIIPLSIDVLFAELKHTKNNEYYVVTAYVDDSRYKGVLRVVGENITFNGRAIEASRFLKLLLSEGWYNINGRHGLSDLAGRYTKYVPVDILDRIK